jgi:hypothetical protein
MPINILRITGRVTYGIKITMANSRSLRTGMTMESIRDNIKIRVKEMAKATVRAAISFGNRKTKATFGWLLFL